MRCCRTRDCGQLLERSVIDPLAAAQNERRSAAGCARQRRRACSSSPCRTMRVMSTALRTGPASPIRSPMRSGASAPCWTRWRDPGLVPGGRRWLLAPPPLDPATAAVLLTLVDGDVAVAGPGIAAAGEWLAFHCGACRPVADPARAAFACRLHAGRDRRAGNRHRRGARDSQRPSILQVASLETGQRYRLRGPGLREARDVARRRAAGRFRRDLAAPTTPAFRAGST